MSEPNTSKPKQVATRRPNPNPRRNASPIEIIVIRSDDEDGDRKPVAKALEETSNTRPKVVPKQTNNTQPKVAPRSSAAAAAKPNENSATAAKSTHTAAAAAAKSAHDKTAVCSDRCAEAVDPKKTDGMIPTRKHTPPTNHSLPTGSGAPCTSNNPISGAASRPDLVSRPRPKDPPPPLQQQLPRTREPPPEKIVWVGATRASKRAAARRQKAADGGAHASGSQQDQQQGKPRSSDRLPSFSSVAHRGVSQMGFNSPQKKSRTSALLPAGRHNFPSFASLRQAYSSYNNSAPHSMNRQATAFMDRTANKFTVSTSSVLPEPVNTDMPLAHHQTNPKTSATFRPHSTTNTGSGVPSAVAPMVASGAAALATTVRGPRRVSGTAPTPIAAVPSSLESAAKRFSYIRLHRNGGTNDRGGEPQWDPPEKSIPVASQVKSASANDGATQNKNPQSPSPEEWLKRSILERSLRPSRPNALEPDSDPSQEVRCRKEIIDLCSTEESNVDDKKQEQSRKRKATLEQRSSVPVAAGGHQEENVENRAAATKPNATAKKTLQGGNPGEGFASVSTAERKTGSIERSNHPSDHIGSPAASETDGEKPDKKYGDGVDDSTETQVQSTSSFESIREKTQEIGTVTHPNGESETSTTGKPRDLSASFSSSPLHVPASDSNTVGEKMRTSGNVAELEDRPAASESAKQVEGNHRISVSSDCAAMQNETFNRKRNHSDGPGSTQDADNDNQKPAAKAPVAAAENESVAELEAVASLKSVAEGSSVAVGDNPDVEDAEDHVDCGRLAKSVSLDNNSSVGEPFDSSVPKSINVTRASLESTSSDDDSNMRARKLKRSKSAKKPLPYESYELKDFRMTVGSESIEKIREGLEMLRQRFRSTGFNAEIEKTFMKTLLSKSIEIADSSRAVVEIWASDRYNPKTNEGAFFDGIDVEQDALESLQLLLDHGADPFAADKHGQTPLHAAMSNGLDCVIGALLDKVKFDEEQLNASNSDGDSPLKLAFVNSHLSWIEEFLEKVGAPMLFSLRDSEGNNILALLVQFTDIKYGNPKRSKRHSKSFAMLQKLLNIIEEKRMVEALLHENKKGENAFHIAATNGCYCEVEAIGKIEFGSGRPVANRCIGNLYEAFVSPLDRAERTSNMLRRKISGSVLTKRAPLALRFGQTSASQKHWLKNGVDPTARLLKQFESHVPVDITDVLQTRPQGAQVCNVQMLSVEAQEFKVELEKKGKLRKESVSRIVESHPQTMFLSPGYDGSDGPRIDVKNFSGFKKKPEGFEKQIKNMLGSGTIKQVTGALVRSPKHSCIRGACDPCARQYGLFAVEDIMCGTIISEYVGLIIRDDEDGPESAYSFKLQKLDDWVLENDKVDDTGFMLDAHLVFNDSCLINDVRTDVLSDDISESAANVSCREVLINGWPHMVFVTTRDIAAREELLTDYGQAYWDRHHSSLYQKQLQERRLKNVTKPLGGSV